MFAAAGGRKPNWTAVAYPAVAPLASRRVTPNYEWRERKVEPGMPRTSPVARGWQRGDGSL
jgi:hypothetical protein